MVRKGYFGDFGGMFVPELLMPPLLEEEPVLVTAQQAPLTMQ